MYLTVAVSPLLVYGHTQGFVGEEERGAEGEVSDGACPSTLAEPPGDGASLVAVAVCRGQQNAVLMCVTYEWYWKS